MEWHQNPLTKAAALLRASCGGTILPTVALPLLLGLVGVYYLFLLSNGTFELFAREAYDNVFNDMLVRLLHGDFTISKTAIGSEAFTRDGKTYTYFGVFPALLRLWALPFISIEHSHLARVSCLLAMLIFVYFQIKMLRIVIYNLPKDKISPFLTRTLMISILLSGPQLYLLGSSWIYHEPVFWAAAIGSAFNLIVLRATLIQKQFSVRDLSLLAALAGLALNTRATVGLTLCLATILLVFFVSTQRWFRAGLDSATKKRLSDHLLTRKIIFDLHVYLPVLVLAAFGLALGIVNYNRWDNPFLFADFRYYDFAHRESHRLLVVRNYGEVNFGRLWISSLYYSTGIPYLLKGVSPFAEYLRSHYDGIEAPPITGLITNPITIIAAAFGLVGIWRKQNLPEDSFTALRLVLVAHSAAIILVLASMYLALRYRLDFSPFMTLSAVLGYYFIALERVENGRLISKQFRVAAVSACILGILASHYVLVIHKVWSDGVPMDVRRALLPYAPFAHAALDKQ